MDLLVKLYDALSRTVGVPAVILVASAFIVAQFADAAAKLLKDHPMAALAAIGLFVLGAFLGFVQVLNSRFEVQAGRGFLEGLAAGALAGLVGGALYAKHARPPYDTWGSAFARTWLLTVAVSAMYGLALSLCHPRAKFHWSERVTAIAVFAMAIMLPVAFVTGYYAEHLLPGDYISFPEIGWTAAAAVTVKAMFPLARLTRGWWPRVARILGLAGAAAIIVWGLNRIFGGSLMSFSDTSATPVALAAIAVLVVCQSIAYFVATTDNPLARLVDGTVPHQGRVHTGKPAR